MSESTKLTGYEHRDEFLQEMGFTSVEIARVQAIRARPHGQGMQSDRGYVPRLFSEYKSWHKRMYAQVFGDVAAETIFGKGPWLRRNYEAEKRRKGLDKKVQALNERQSHSLDVLQQSNRSLYSSHSKEKA